MGKQNISKPNAFDMDINSLFDRLKAGGDVSIKKPKEEKKTRKKISLDDMLHKTELQQSVEATRDLILKWEQQQLPDALVMVIEFCHCNHCHHDWRQLKYGALMIRWRNRKADLYTYRPFEVSESLDHEKLPKVVQIEVKEFPYCMSCFMQMAMLENLSKGYVTRSIIQGSELQLDIFEETKRNEHSTETGPRVSNPAREQLVPEVPNLE